MSLVYERRQSSKIAFARILLVFLFLTFILLMFSEYREYCILLTVLLAFLMFPTISELKIFKNKVEIKIYYCLAGVYRTYLLQPENQPQISSFEIELEPNPDEGSLFPGTLFTGALLIKHYKFRFLKSGSEKKFSVRLTDEEYKKIISVLR